MTRDHAITVLHDALIRQKARDPNLSLVQTQTPDAYLVTGVIDVHALAEAIADATQRRRR